MTMIVIVPINGFVELSNILGRVVKQDIRACVLSTTDLKPLTPNGQPLIAAVGMVFSIALAIFTIKRMSKKK